MATFFDPTHGRSTTGLLLGTDQSEPLYPQYPCLSALFAQQESPNWPPSINPDYTPSGLHLDPPPTFGSAVGSVYPLTLASQLDTSQHVPSTCNGTGSLYPITYPKPPVLYSSYDFKPRESLCSLPPIVSIDYMASVPVLSEQTLAQIDKLTTMDYDGYHPWQIDESNPVGHAIISKVMSEVTAKFPNDATPEGFMNRLAICEKAIFEIEQLPTLTSEDKVMLELGIRDTMSKHIEIFEANKLGDVYASTKAVPNHLENIPFYLNQFATRGGYYLPSRDVDHLQELLNTIRHHFTSSLETFVRQNITSLPLSEQFTRCHALINDQLKAFASTPNTMIRLQFAAHQALTQSLIEHHVPLCKEAYKKGQPLPLDLTQMLDGLYFLATNNGNFILFDGQDPRQTFIESVFGTDNIAELRKQIGESAQTEKTRIEFASTLPGEPVQPKSFWSKLNIFSREPSPEELARQAAARKASALSQVDAKQNAQGLAIDQLEGYMTRPQQPITTPDQFKPSAPPFDIVESLYPQLPITEPIPVPVIGDKPLSVLPTGSAIHTPASNKVTLTFPEAPKKPKPTGSYIHIAFHDLLERTAADEDLFGQFPKPVQRDLMRHLFHTRLVGPAEARIEAAFQKHVDGKKVAHINHLYTRELAQLDKQMKTTTRSPEQEQGEEILSLYYQGKQNDETFLDKLSAFPASDLFLYYVWDIAKNANVEIPDTDHDWARGHYKDPQFVHLTMQALERLLHTS